MYDVNVGVNLGVSIASPELLHNNGQPIILNIHNGRVVSFIELVRARSMCHAAEYVVKKNSTNLHLIRMVVRIH